MKTVIELLTEARDAYGSDRKAAIAFAVTQTTFSDWRNGDAFPTDDHGLKIAELMRLDPAYVLAIIRHDRTSSERARKVWRRVADQFKNAAMIAAMSIGAASLGGFNNNAFANPSGSHSGNALSSGPEYTLCNNRRKKKHRRGALAWLFGERPWTS